MGWLRMDWITQIDGEFKLFNGVGWNGLEQKGDDGEGRKCG